MTTTKLGASVTTCIKVRCSGWELFSRDGHDCKNVVPFCQHIIIMHAFLTRAHSVVVLSQRRWQSLDEQHGKGVDGLFEKVSFQTAFEGVESW